MKRTKFPPLRRGNLVKLNGVFSFMTTTDPYRVKRIKHNGTIELTRYGGTDTLIMKSKYIKRF